MNFCAASKRTAFWSTTSTSATTTARLDVVGALNVQKRCGAEFAPVLILVVPPDEETLIRRLEGRASEDEDALRERLARARYELSLKDQYDYVVVNDDLKETAARLHEIVLAENAK